MEIQKLFELQEMPVKELVGLSIKTAAEVNEAIDLSWMPRAKQQKPDTELRNHIRNFNKPIKTVLKKILQEKGVELTDKIWSKKYEFLNKDLIALYTFLHVQALNFIKNKTQEKDFDYKVLNKEFFNRIIGIHESIKGLV